MRVIRKSATTSSREAIELLASLFAMELIKPSRCLWITSPWVSDLQLIDNRLGTFPALDRRGRRQIRLSEVLVQLATQGTTIVLATRDLPINESFIARLKQLAREEGVTDLVLIRRVPSNRRLHDKALTADDFVVAGSMNLTFSGAMLNEEQIQLHTDPEFVSATQMDMHQRFGGILR